MKWKTKALAQRAIGLLPARDMIYLALQRRVGGLAQFDSECKGKIEDWKNMAGHLRSVGRRITGTRCFEIGTGWYPTFPLCNFLAGAGTTTTVDLHRHLQPDLTLRCIEHLAARLEEIAAAVSLPVEEISDRCEHLRCAWRAGADLEAATAGSVDYRAPSDARETGLPSASIDLVFSNSVLEHVPQSDIESLMRESFRILGRGGMIFHSVNCGDHYSYIDGNITQLNYLQFSDRQWERYNNQFLYQNRLRACEFPELARQAGFEVILNTAHATAKRLEELRGVPIHERFKQFPPEELCITTVDFIAVKP